MSFLLCELRDDVCCLLFLTGERALRAGKGADCVKNMLQATCARREQTSADRFLASSRAVPWDSPINRINF